MNKIFYFILITYCSTTAQAVEVQLHKAIEIQPLQAAIGYLGSFAIAQNGAILALDIKTSDIKTFDSDGRWVNTFGRKGNGPGEFGMPLFCDYRPPYFAVMDAGRRKIILFELKNGLTPEFFKEIPCPALGIDLKITKENNIIISGHAADAKGIFYELYSHSWTNNDRRFLLPAHMKYGMISQAEYHQLYRNNIVEYAGIGLRGFIGTVDDDIFFVWEGALKIIHLKSDGRVVKTFGRATDNFIKPAASKALKEAYRKSDGLALAKERRKSSQIFGLFADPDFVGLLYANFDQSNETRTIFLQLYSPSGELLDEKALMTESEEEVWAIRPVVYLRSRKELFILTDKMTPGLYENYRLHVFKIDGSQED